jgi:peptidyl-prolyl cis-trans isomerase SurA
LTSNRCSIGGRGGIVRAAICIGVACGVAAAATPGRALAQQVVLVVNGDVITDYDIEQRSKFTALSTHKTPARQEVIEDLIDERLKIQVGKKYKVEVPDSDVDSSFADMSKRMRITADQLSELLAKSGVNASTLKSRIKADLTWTVIIRGKFQSSLQVTEKSVLAEIATTKKSDGGDIGYDYTLRPVLLLVPPGNTQLAEARRKDAEDLRTRFTACDTGLTLARLMRDVIVRDAITKNSSELAPVLREIIEKTEVGHLTPPETTQQGVEMFALCLRKETTSETPEKREAREKIFGESFQNQAKRYLRELRRQAMIERK